MAHQQEQELREAVEHYRATVTQLQAVREELAQRERIGSGVADQLAKANQRVNELNGKIVRIETELKDYKLRGEEGAGKEQNGKNDRGQREQMLVREKEAEEWRMKYEAELSQQHIKDSTIDELNRTINNQEQQITALKNTLAQHDQDFSILNNTIQQQEQHIATANNKIY